MKKVESLCITCHAASHSMWEMFSAQWRAYF